MPEALSAYLDRESRRVAGACTACGTCVRVCPVAPSGRAATDPEGTVGGVLALLREGAPAEGGAADWLASCNGCGLCIPECPEEVDPRHMLILASHRANELRTQTPELFKRMARAIKLMAAMQLVPDEFRRLFASGDGDAEVVFYTGCNALKTPHLLFNAMRILDALGVDYDVAGGPAACCGVIAAKWEGRPAAGERQVRGLNARFDGFRAGRVLNWCPSCELHLKSTLRGFEQSAVRFEHLVEFLVERLQARGGAFPTRIERRVVLHGHVGAAAVTGAVETLLRAIPGLDLVETVWESSYTCGGSGCSKAPELSAREHAEALDRTEAAGADALVTLFHGCHSMYVHGARGRPFDVVNFTDLVAMALDRAPHRDGIKAFRDMGDVSLVIEEALPMLRANGVTIEAGRLAELLPELFTSAEFRGGLAALSVRTP